MGHGRVLDRHHAFEKTTRDDEAADVLRQVARKAHQFIGERNQANDDWILGIEAGFADALVLHVSSVPETVHTGEPVDLREIEPERLADVAYRALRPIGDERGGECGTLAAVFFVDVLDYFLAPLVLEVDIDIR